MHGAIVLALLVVAGSALAERKVDLDDRIGRDPGRSHEHADRSCVPVGEQGGLGRGLELGAHSPRIAAIRAR